MSLHINPADHRLLVAHLAETTAGAPTEMGTLYAEQIVVDSSIPQGKMLMMPQHQDPGFRGGPQISGRMKYVVFATSFKSCGVVDDEDRQSDFDDHDPFITPGLVGKWVEDPFAVGINFGVRARYDQINWVIPEFHFVSATVS